MKKTIISLMPLLLALTAPLSATADDIELFAGAGSAGGTPDVMFVLDNAANFSANVVDQRCNITAAGVVTTDGSAAPATNTNLDKTSGAVEQCAIYSALASIDVSAEAKINIGFMGFNAQDMKTYDPVTDTFSQQCVGNTGGCAMMPIVPFNATTKPRILNWIRLWAISGNSDYVVKGNNTGNGAAMQETWAYFYSKRGVSGRLYNSGDLSTSCANKYVIFVGNAFRNNATPGDGTNEDNSPRKPLEGTSLATDKWAAPAATPAQKTDVTGNWVTSCGTSALQIAEGKGAYALKWARYMYQTREIITYSVGVLGPTCNAEYAAHLSQLGEKEFAGGRYFATTNYEELVLAFQTATNEIMARESAFASVSLPVSVNTQGTYLNQVYIGMFRPAQNFLPRWPGNLKQYRLGVVGDAIRLLDAQNPGQPAISSGDSGFIAECARSYWTPTTDTNYWTEFSDANCSPHIAASDTPDGNVVEKGAQSYMLRDPGDTTAPAARNVKTCGNATCTSLTNFNSSISTALVSKAALGDAAMSDTARTDLINWARGLNNHSSANETDDFQPATNMRPSVHADIVHSRPVAINYGTDAAPQVVVFYGANDGMLRAINGNRDVYVDPATNVATPGLPIGGVAPGDELWSFVPPEFYGKYSRLRANTVPISYSGTLVAGALPKDYGFDGPVVAHKGATSTSIYATMRRGGRNLYAFDVTTPETPTMLWRAGCPNAADDTGCSAPSGDISGIGQTWSPPSIIFAQGYGGGATPLLIMGGGYDTCEDEEDASAGANHNCASGTPKGSHIYVLDAATGAILKTFNTSRSVIAGVTVKNDVNDHAQYGYTADTGGNVYRINMLTDAPADWTMTHIATLGCGPTATVTCTANRKFMFAPDVVTDGTTNYILLGSGDREKPLVSYTVTTGVQNHFYMIKDQPLTDGWLSGENTNCNANIICLASLAFMPKDPTDPDTPSSSEIASKKGWYLEMDSSEQAVTSAITVSNIVTFSTHKPSVYNPSTCTSSLGTASVYNINYKTSFSVNGLSASRKEDIKGGGLPPSPVAGQVTLDDGTTVPFLIGSNPTSPLEGGAPPGTVSWGQPKSRVYWYIQQ